MWPNFVVFFLLESVCVCVYIYIYIYIYIYKVKSICVKGFFKHWSYGFNDYVDTICESQNHSIWCSTSWKLLVHTIIKNKKYIH